VLPVRHATEAPEGPRPDILRLPEANPGFAYESRERRAHHFLVGDVLKNLSEGVCANRHSILDEFKPCDAGLNRYSGVTLAEAREAAKEHRNARDKGVNPLAERLRKEAAEAAAKREEEATRARAAAHSTTFAMAAEQYISGQEASWSNASYRA